MKMALMSLCLLFSFCVVFLSPSAEAIMISGAGTWGSFEGSIGYTCDQTLGRAQLTVKLTNTSPAGNGGYITALALNNPGERVAGVTLADTVFDLLGSPGFQNSIAAVPWGHYDIGAGMGGSWLGGGDPKPGIAVGESRTFDFSMVGSDLCDLSGMSFVSEGAEGGTDFLIVRFRGFENGESDKVPPDAVIVPVTLTSFTAVGHIGRIEIQWTSQTEINALSYHLYRSEDDENQYHQIATVDAQGNSEIQQEYRYTDKDVEPGRTYYYRLADEDYQGNIELHKTVSASAASNTIIPRSYALRPNYPNPFNASTIINYQIPKASFVSLTVYDVLGRTARELVNEHQQAGDYKIKWDGRDGQGREMKSGVYFCVFKAGSASETMKMVLSR
ncbi:FlgD immunoglobulin-like domain containing protein [Candidatus Zixiibacteriota bacterium]